MNATWRTIISYSVAVLIAIFVYAVMPIYSSAPQGIVLPTNGEKQPYLGEVTLYDSLSAPFDVKTIGNISVEYHNITATPEAESNIINKAKYLSAQAGGDGLIFFVGHTSLSVPSAMAMLVLRGTVIKSQ